MFMKQKVRVAISTPMVVWDKDGVGVYEPISPLWHRARMAMSTGTNINLTELFADGLEVGDARSQIAALCLAQDPPPEFLFFIDSDVLVPVDAMTKLLFRATCFPNYDVYAGVYCLKNPQLPEPLIYGEPGQGPLWDWAIGDLLTTESHGVKATHMGLTLIRTSLFRRMLGKEVDCVDCVPTVWTWPNGKTAKMLKNGKPPRWAKPAIPPEGKYRRELCPFCMGNGVKRLVGGDGQDQEDEPFFKTIKGERQQAANGAIVLQMGTEDIYFYMKAAQVGCRILVDTSVLAGHHDWRSGQTFGLPWQQGPVSKARWMTCGGKSKDREEAEAAGLKLAVDLGAGGQKRAWEGHVTYTTDYRPGVGVDYVQDTRLLNFPDNHWDLVASRHHLEHLPRYEQEKVWQEMYRVTKPGGRCEHIVPSIEWAAWKIKEGCADGFVYDVLYGGQEAYGEGGLHWNSHYFGYTKEVAKSLAEQAGWTDVTVEDSRDREELGYEMNIRGVKPTKETPTESKMQSRIKKRIKVSVNNHQATLPQPAMNGHAVNGKKKAKR